MCLRHGRCVGSRRRTADRRLQVPRSVPNGGKGTTSKQSRSKVGLSRPHQERTVSIYGSLARFSGAMRRPAPRLCLADGLAERAAGDGVADPGGTPPSPSPWTPTATCRRRPWPGRRRRWTRCSARELEEFLGRKRALESGRKNANLALAQHTQELIAASPIEPSPTFNHCCPTLRLGLMKRGVTKSAGLGHCTKAC